LPAHTHMRRKSLPVRAVQTALEKLFDMILDGTMHIQNLSPAR